MKKVFFLSVPALALAALAGVGLSQKVSQTKAVAYDSATTTYTETVVFPAGATVDLGGKTLNITTTADLDTSSAGAGVYCAGALTLSNGTLNITSKGNGIYTTAALDLENVNVTATTGGDGIKTTGCTIGGSSVISLTSSTAYNGSGITGNEGAYIKGTSQIVAHGYKYGIYANSGDFVFADSCSFTTEATQHGIGSWGDFNLYPQGGTLTLHGEKNGTDSGNAIWCNSTYSLTQTGGSIAIDAPCWGNTKYTCDFKGGTFTFNTAASYDVFSGGSNDTFKVEGGNVKLINTDVGNKTAINMASGAISVASGRFELTGFYDGIGSWGSSTTTDSSGSTTTVCPTSFSHTGGRFCGSCSNQLVYLNGDTSYGKSYIKDYYIDDFKTAIDAVTCTSLKADITGTMNTLKTDYDKIYAEDVDELDVASSAHENMNYSAVYAYYLRYAEANGWSSSGAKPLLASNNDNGTLLIGAISSLAIVVALSYCLLRHKRRA